MIYTYQCPMCGKINDVQRCVDDRDLTLSCDCGGNMARIFSPGDISLICDGDMAHRHDAWGVDIRGRSHWKQELAKRGEVEYEPQPAMAEAIRYSRIAVEHARRGDKSARKEVAGILRQADRKMRRERIRKAID